MINVVISVLVVFCGIQSIHSDTLGGDASSDSLVSSSSSGEMSLSVTHSLDQGANWGLRGKIVVPSARASSGNAPTMEAAADDTTNVLDRLKELCEADAMYMLRVTSEDGAAAAAVTRTETATHACNLVESGMRDVFTVHLDWRNKVVAVSVTPGETSSPSQGSSFRTKVLVQHMEPGPQPDTAAFIQRMEQEKLAKERGETKDNRSFFAKYWMYIIPVVLVLAMSGGQEGGNGGGR